MIQRFRRHPDSSPRALGIAVVVALAAVIAASGVISANTYKRVSPEPIVGGVSADEYSAKQQSLHAWLMAEMPFGTLDHPIVVGLSDEEQADLKRRQETPGGPAVVGRTKPVTEVIRFSARDAALLSRSPTRNGHGVFQSTEDGGFVWATSIRSEGASALRVHISAMNLPDGSDIFFFNTAGRAFGPYTRGGPHGDGDFWSHTITGSEGIILLRNYGPNAKDTLRGTSFRISDVGHIGASFPGVLSSQESFCSFNVDCIENAECENFAGGSAGDEAQRAIALMQWIAGAFINVCTGGLIADTDPGAQPRYFLTANHCINKGKDARNLETYFQFTVPCGTSNCPGQTTQPGATQVLGSSIRDTSTNGDHTLLELNGNDPLPGNAVFLGWNNSPVANSDGVTLQRVSHPAWAPQAYSSQDVNTSAGTCNTLPRGEFIYSTDTFGGTEGGSSGAPVWNSAGEIVGQLFGACGTNINDECDSASNATVDGALAHYFPDVEEFLNPAGCVVTEPGTELSCNDGQDNDCDGATDCNDSPDCDADPACQTGGCINPGGAPVGASCTVDADCCNDKCKGGPNNKTCK